MSLENSPDLGQSRIEVLDGLRAMAIALVLACHVITPFWTDPSRPFLPQPFSPFGVFLINGWCGVDLFFVLSGFLITRQILAGDTIRHFYKKRFMRIAPMYYIVLTLACLRLFPTYPVYEPAHVWGWRYIYHLLFMQDFLWCDILPVFWTLAVEFHFYIIAPFLIAGLLRFGIRKRFTLLALAALLSVAVKAWVAFYWFPHGVSPPVYLWRIRMLFPLQLDGFISGITVAFLWNDKRARVYMECFTVANGLFWSGLGLLIALTASSVRLRTHIANFDIILLNPLLALAFGSMALGLLGGCKGHKAFMARSLRFIALISYSLYLIHEPLIPVLLRSPFAITSENHVFLKWLVFLIPYLFLNVVLASMTYFFIEKPCIDWSRKRKPLISPVSGSG